MTEFQILVASSNYHTVHGSKHRSRVTKRRNKIEGKHMSFTNSVNLMAIDLAKLGV